MRTKKQLLKKSSETNLHKQLTIATTLFVLIFLCIIIIVCMASYLIWTWLAGLTLI